MDPLNINYTLILFYLTCIYQYFRMPISYSNYALGAVHLQGEGHDERPVEYASRMLTSAERNYSTAERGALAIVWAVEKFREYIDRTKIMIGTDHQPLRWLFSLRLSSGRPARWDTPNTRVRYRSNVYAWKDKRHRQGRRALTKTSWSVGFAR